MKNISILLCVLFFTVLAKSQTAKLTEQQKHTVDSTHKLIKGKWIPVNDTAGYILFKKDTLIINNTKKYNPNPEIDYFVYTYHVSYHKSVLFLDRYFIYYVDTNGVRHNQPIRTYPVYESDIKICSIAMDSLKLGSDCTEIYKKSKNINYNPKKIKPKK